MSQSSGKMLISALFGALCLTFAGIAVAPWLIDPLDYLAPGDGVAAPEIRIRTEGLATLEAPAFDSLAIIVERPLFTATRRPAPDLEPMPVAAAVAAKPLDKSLILGRYKLTGIVVSPGLRLVFVTEPGSRRTTAVALGKELDGWLVSEVEQHVIVLESNGRRKVIRIGEDATIEITTE